MDITIWLYDYGGAVAPADTRNAGLDLLCVGLRIALCRGPTGISYGTGQVREIECDHDGIVIVRVAVDRSDVCQWFYPQNLRPEWV